MFISLRNHASIFALALGAVLTACATPPRNTAGNDVGPPAMQQNSACLSNNVASRIPQTGPQCSAVGRTYSSDDISRTGATTAGQALQLLDPAITVSH